MKEDGINKVDSSDLSEVCIKDIVSDNFHAADLFEKMGIDYCCGGRKKLSDALAEKDISLLKFKLEFEQLNKKDPYAQANYFEWELDLLSKHIVTTHHVYVKEAIPRISVLIQKVVNAHGSKYSYLLDVNTIFIQLAYEMNSHMLKEERMLFPLIKYLVESKKYNEAPKTNGYGSIQNPINQMEREHISAGGACESIRKLTNNFTLPEDACPTFQVTYRELDEFEKDLHKHVHLENNILFPRAVALENELIGKPVLNIKVIK